MILRINNFPISSGFGSIDDVHKIPHKGVDIAMPSGTELRSIADGIISRINDYGPRSSGKTIWIKLQDGTEVMYGHLSEIQVQANQHVHAGEVIGLSGNTGFSTGPHLHLQLVSANGNLIDPTPVVESPWWDQLIHGKGLLYPIFDPNASMEGHLKNKLYEWLAHKGQIVVDLINANAAEVITLGIVVCAAGMMLAPMMGSTAGKWMGRMFVVFLLGVIWSVFI